MALPVGCEQGLVLLLFMDQTRATLGLSWVRSSLCQWCSYMELQALSWCCFLRSFHWWARLPSDQISAPSPLLGATTELVRVFIFSPPQDRSHLERYCPMLGLFTYFHACGTDLDRLLPRVCWTGWIHKRMQGQGILEHIFFYYAL